MFRVPVLLGGAALAATALTACSSSIPSSHHNSSGARSPGREKVTACSALAPFDAAIVAYPGVDPEAPKPTAAQLEAWATEVRPHFDAIARNVPAAVDPDVATVRPALDGVSRGTALNPEDATLTSALTAIDRWGHDSCGFEHVDVVGAGTELTGVPATAPAGTVSIAFSNRGPREKAGFILLIAKIKDGAKYTIDQIRDNKIELAAIADIVAVAQPSGPTATAYTTVDFAPGHYILTTPTGTPPRFGATLATEVEVG